MGRRQQAAGGSGQDHGWILLSKTSFVLFCFVLFCSVRFFLSTEIVMQYNAMRCNAFPYGKLHLKRNVLSSAMLQQVCQENKKLQTGRPFSKSIKDYFDDREQEFARISAG